MYIPCFFFKQKTAYEWRISDWSSDVCSSDLYFDILFHDRRALPPMPWPAPAILVGHRRREAAFEQSVLDEIGRGPEQFLPGEEAARIHQPALLAWGAHDRVIDPSAMDLYAARMPQIGRAHV